MIIHLKSEYRAANRDDALVKAGEQWCVFLGDPKAKLPWSTTLDITPGRDEDPQPYVVNLLVKETDSESGVMKSGG